jgi:anti-sigma regulatory factor (Ser/Thr protein kinase)
MPGLTNPAPEVRERLVWRAGSEDLDSLYPLLDAISEQTGLPTGVAFRIHVALEEAAANALSHGYELGCSGDVTLEIAAMPSRVVAVLRDAGRPFNPLQQTLSPTRPTSIEEAAIGGLGVTLMRKFSSALAYRRAGEMNELTMTFDVDAMVKPAGGDK